MQPAAHGDALVVEQKGRFACRERLRAGAEELPYISFNIFFTACKSASTSSNDVA